MDPLRLSLALGPLALYLLSIGRLHLRRRATVVTGSRDLVALALGVSGLITIGPVELLMPQAAIANFGAAVWGMMAIIYSLCVSLAILNGRPQLVIYNAPPLSEFRPIMARVIDELDPESRWAGTSLLMPRLPIELAVEIAPASNTIVLRAVHEHQQMTAWRQLHAALARQLATVPRASSPWGFGMSGLAAVLLALVGWQLVEHSQEVTQALVEMLRLGRADSY
jgi:hypothetical protein